MCIFSNNCINLWKKVQALNYITGEKFCAAETVATLLIIYNIKFKSLKKDKSEFKKRKYVYIILSLAFIMKISNLTR